MKKRLEAELISIAHRILKLKNKSEVDQLYIESKKLYETLTVLKFYGDNYETVKNEISQESFEEKLDILLEKEEEKPIEVASKKDKKQPVVENNTHEEVEIVVEQTTQIEEEKELNFDAIFELASEEITNEKGKTEPVNQVVEDEKTETVKQISFDEILNENYDEPVFVKTSEKDTKTQKVVAQTEVLIEKTEEKSQSLNDKLAKGINIGLNDRIAFVKQLFNESNEDFNRVISQLNTFNSLNEAQTFIDEMVKPDYNNWEGKDDYAQRFIEILEKKFN